MIPALKIGFKSFFGLIIGYDNIAKVNNTILVRRKLCRSSQRHLVRTHSGHVTRQICIRQNQVVLKLTVGQIFRAEIPAIGRYSCNLKV